MEIEEIIQEEVVKVEEPNTFTL